MHIKSGPLNVNIDSTLVRNIIRKVDVRWLCGIPSPKNVLATFTPTKVFSGI